jgi:hypothetical protein
MNRAPTLGQAVRAFKAGSCRAIRVASAPAFSWQRNYHERIIRDDAELERIRAYILDNPSNWVSDDDNPCRGRV